MIRIGKISYWHVHAWDYTKQAENHPDTEIVAVWDENPLRGQEAAGKLQVPFYASLTDMLHHANVDAVIVDAPTNLHHDIMMEVASLGKHIFTEKVLAPTRREAQEIAKEMSKKKLKLTVSLPRINEGYTLTIREILKQGVLGKITLVRTRLSHHGAIAGWLPDHFYDLEQCKGGAMIDLGCHPMYLTSCFLQEPIHSVQASYGYMTGKEVEDNAVCMLTTKSGAIGIVEAGFVNSCSPFSIEIHGTEGTLLFGTPENKLLIRSKNEKINAENWTAWPLVEKRKSDFEQWVDHIQNDTIGEENIQIAIELSKLMEASNESAQKNCTVFL